MNNTQKKALCLALLLATAPTALRAMENPDANAEVPYEDNQGINIHVLPGQHVIIEEPADVGEEGINIDLQNQQNLPAGVDLDLGQPPMPTLNFRQRILGRVNGAMQGTQERWNGMSPRTKTATKVAAGAGILGAAGFLGHKLYKWWTKPVVKVLVSQEETPWEVRFAQFGDQVLLPMIGIYSPNADDAVIMRSIITEAIETLQPDIVLGNEAFVGLLTPEQKAELEEICVLAAKS